MHSSPKHHSVLELLTSQNINSKIHHSDLLWSNSRLNTSQISHSWLNNLDIFCLLTTSCCFDYPVAHREDEQSASPRQRGAKLTTERGCRKLEWMKHTEADRTESPKQRNSDSYFSLGDWNQGCGGWRKGRRKGRRKKRREKGWEEEGRKGGEGEGEGGRTGMRE